MADIDIALGLEPGARVRVPEDRGLQATTGTVVLASDGKVRRNIHGREYTSLSIKRDDRGHTEVWPSNRISVLSHAA